jgi:glyoxylase-like metal-dependent hydrolase (beta-lactamase superfamily II)
MKIHHLNCATIHIHLPYPGVTHSLLLEGEDSLTLIDTGFGMKDYTSPSCHVDLFLKVNGILRDVNETAIEQVIKLGFNPQDVRRIVLTHLHLDHAGGIQDFPWAEVHILKTEYETAKKPRKLSWIDHIGYVQFYVMSKANWVLHSLHGEERFGFDCVRVLEKSTYNVFLVPLVGHSRGHCGIAVETGDVWLFHCGDAYVRDIQIDPEEPRDPFPILIGPITRQLFPENTIRRIRELRREHSDQIAMFSSHDPIEYSRLRGISIEEAIGLAHRSRRLGV